MKILLVFFLILLSGCSLFKPRIEYISVTTPVVCNEAEAPESLRMLPVTWQNATSKEGKEVLALDGKNYSNLSINIADIKSYLEKQKLLIAYYQNCIDRHNKKGPQ